MNAKSIRPAVAVVCAALLGFMCPERAAAQSSSAPYGVWQGQDARGATVTMIVTPGRFRITAGDAVYAGSTAGWERMDGGGVLAVRYPNAVPPNDTNRYFVSYRSRNSIVVGNQSFRVPMQRLSR